MKEKTSKNVRFYYGIIFSAFTVVVGALFIWQVLSLYFTGTAEGFTGTTPFTRERVAEALSKIDLFFWLWIAGVIVGFILWEVFPVKQRVRKICPDLQYARLIKRVPSAPPEGLSGEYRQLAEKRKLMFALKCAAWGLFGIAAIYGIVYLAIPSHFTKDAGESVATPQVLDMVYRVFPCIFAGLLVVCGVAVYEKYTVKALLPVVQKLAKGQKVEKTENVFTRAEAVLQNKWVVLGIRCALLVVAVTLIIVGALNGNMTDIFNKAVAICSQCIGLG